MMSVKIKLGKILKIWVTVTPQSGLVQPPIVNIIIILQLDTLE